MVWNRGVAKGWVNPPSKIFNFACIYIHADMQTHALTYIKYGLITPPPKKFLASPLVWNMREVDWDT